MLELKDRTDLIIYLNPFLWEGIKINELSTKQLVYIWNYVFNNENEDYIY